MIKYKNNHIDVFLSPILQITNTSLIDLLYQAISYHSPTIFEYLCRVLIEERRIVSEDITPVILHCIGRNKLSYLKIMNNTRAFSTFFTGIQSIPRIKSHETYHFLQQNVKMRDVFNRRFLYYMISCKNMYFVKKCVETSPYSICTHKHKALGMTSTPEIELYLLKHHPCGGGDDML